MPRLGLIFPHLASADGCNERRCCRQAADSICPPSARFFSGSSQHCLQYNPSAELIAGWPSSPNFTLEASFAGLFGANLPPVAAPPQCNPSARFRTTIAGCSPLHRSQ